MEDSIVRAGALAITPTEALAQLKEVESVIKGIMKDGEHYGLIPGTGTKKTLLQPGAQLLANVYQYADQDVEFVDKTEQWGIAVTESTFPLFAYTIRIPFFDRNGRKVSVGIGQCSSYETRYRWRDSARKCPTCGKETIIKGKEEYGGGWLCFAKKGGCGAKYKADDPAIASQKVGRMPNEAIHDQVNTIIKIAKKRAYVNGVIGATRTSGMFTQDMEDFATIQDVEVVSSVPSKTPPVQYHKGSASKEEEGPTNSPPDAFNGAFDGPRPTDDWKQGEREVVELMKEINDATTPTELKTTSKRANLMKDGGVINEVQYDEVSKAGNWKYDAIRAKK